MMLTGIAHRPWMYQQFLVLGGTVQLALDYEVEVRRFEVYQPLISSFGVKFIKRHFDTAQAYPRDGSVRCYDAAYQSAFANPSLIYCEGVAVFLTPDRMIPMGHGWCCKEDGTIVDPTLWKYQADHRVLYFGVPIRLDYAERWQANNGFHGVLDGYPDGRYSPIFTESPNLWLDTRCN